VTVFDVSSVPPELPPYYRRTWEMIARAFPDGVTAEHYWPLTILLGEHMSFRSVAAFMGFLFRREPGLLYHDALTAASHPRPRPPSLDMVRQRLLACGYADWLEAED
jgi:hypothetical protein